MSGKLSQEHFTLNLLRWGVTEDSCMLFIKTGLNPSSSLREPFVKLKGNLGPVESEKVFQNNNNKPLISPAHTQLSAAKEF